MFTGSFSISGAAGFNVFIDTDTSNFDSEPVETFLTRRLSLTPVSGANLVPTGTQTTYIPFPFGSNTLTVNIPMTRDYALLLTMEWVSLNPQMGSTYTATKYALFESYNLYNEYGLISAMTGRPNIQQDANYWLNMGKVRTNIVNAENAIIYEQQRISQAATNRVANLLANQNTFF